MKLKHIIIPTILIFTFLGIATTQAQTKATKLEKGSLQWENERNTCFSVHLKDDTPLARGNYIGNLSDFTTGGTGTITFTVNEEGVLDGLFEIDAMQGVERLKGKLKNGCYDGELIHYFNNEVVSRMYFENNQIIKAREKTKEGDVVITYQYDGVRFTATEKYPDGSWSEISGVDNQTQVVKRFNASGAMVTFLDYINKEQKKWNENGVLEYYSYEEPAEVGIVNRIVERYKNGNINEKITTKEPIYKSENESFIEKTTLNYHENGKKEEELIFRNKEEKTGNPYNILCKFDETGTLIYERKMYYDTLKKIDMISIAKYNNGRKTSEDLQEVPTISPPDTE